jgi:hypothetical protein
MPPNAFAGVAVLAIMLTISYIGSSTAPLVGLEPHIGGLIWLGLFVAAMYLPTIRARFFARRAKAPVRRSEDDRTRRR